MKKVYKFVLAVVFVFALGFGTLFILSRRINDDTNPHFFVTDTRQKERIESIKRIDEEGNLYYINYTADYNKSLVGAFSKFLNIATKSSCTSFLTSDIDTKEIINARNFDTTHLNDDNELETMALIIELNPENAYRSLNVFDVLYYWNIGIKYHPGNLDDGIFDNSILAVAPWICMDGINEKGLSVSIMTVDVLDGEKPTHQKIKGKEDCVCTVLLRKILDNCANCDEAIKVAKNVNMRNITGTDFHLLVCDKNGRSIALEWRYNELYVTETDCVTNFYVSFDDAKDCYYDDGTYLKEAFKGKADVSYSYHYGYGHGYERFNTVVKKLDEGIISDFSCKTRTALKNDDIVKILQDVKQYYENGYDSHTQYSGLYNNTNNSLTVFSNQNYSKGYDFKKLSFYD